LKQETNVYVQEFQTESTLPSRSLIDQRPRSLINRALAQAGIESMLLALRFRNWLSDSEKCLLDLLVPDRSLIFLANQGEYLHPENTPLGPLDGLMSEASVTTFSEAIFSRRFCPEHNGESETFRVQTAGLCTQDDIRLVIGHLSPDLSSTHADESEFTQLVRQFRNAWAATIPIANVLKKRFERIEGPWLVVNRAAGRVLLANEAAAGALGLTLDRLIDSEYSSISDRYVSLSPGRKLSMDNVTVDGIHLSIVSHVANERPSETTLDPQVDFLVHGMRNKISAVMTAVSHLDTIAAHDLESEERELTGIIMSEVANLDAYLNRMELLFNYDKYPVRSITLSDELAETVRRSAEWRTDKGQVNLQVYGIDTVACLPVVALNVLFDSALRSHLGHKARRSLTEIAISEQTDQKRVIVNIQTAFADVNHVPAFVVAWQQYCERLCRLMNAVITQHVAGNGTVLTTNLEIPVNVE